MKHEINTLTGLDAYVLSHGHYDHSGGFEELFRRAPAAKVYARKEALDVYLSAAGEMHEIRVPQNVAFRQEGIEQIYTGHCTGTPGYEKLNAVFHRIFPDLCFFRQ